MKKLIPVAGMVLVAIAAMTATSVAKSTQRHASIDVAVLLPDTKSSVRWETQDRPDLAKAFKAAGLNAQIVNALNDPQKQRQQAKPGHESPPRSPARATV